MHLQLRLCIILLAVTMHLHAASKPSTLTVSHYGFHTEKDVSAKAKAMAAMCGFMLGMAEQTLAFKYFLFLSSTSDTFVGPYVWITGNWIVSAGLAFWMKESCEGRMSKLQDSDKINSAAKIVADNMYRQGKISVAHIPQMEKAYVQARDRKAVTGGETLCAYHNILMRKAVLSTFFWRGCATAMLGGPLSGIVGCYISHQAGIINAPFRL